MSDEKVKRVSKLKYGTWQYLENDLKIVIKITKEILSIEYNDTNTEIPCKGDWFGTDDDFYVFQSIPYFINDLDETRMRFGLNKKGSALLGNYEWVYIFTRLE